jgi:CYTH domain-containing protein
MPAEIERKFIAEDAPARAGAPVRMRQGYLAIGPESEVRVRDAAGLATLTVKSGSGLVRTETEIDLTPQQFEALWPATEGRRIEKRRSAVALDSLTAEYDVYEGDLAGLAVVEVEFASLEAAQGFVAPEWFGREVTGDAAYKNASLATRGKPEES